MNKINLIKLLKYIVFVVDVIAIAIILFSLIWVKLDLDLTILCWLTLFVIFYDLLYNKPLN